MKTKRPVWILPTIIFSQFAGTSPWFAGNAVMEDLAARYQLGESAIGAITSSVQFGFIAGTFCFAILTLADRFSPRLIFLCCSVLGAGANLLILMPSAGPWSLILPRLATGFFLAGVYPVGMKIAAGWYARGLGKALGFLVGALVLGTAFPHLVKSLGGALDWRMVLVTVSSLSVLGGACLYVLVPDGPHLPRSGAPFDAKACLSVFRSRDFRAAAFGYFGHMWELYAFWAFIPFLLQAYRSRRQELAFDVSGWTFLIIAVGFLGCAVGGLISQRMGGARVALCQLVASGCCCLLSPLAFGWSAPFFLGFLLVWGVTVIGDSPQFSALSAQTAPRKLVGTALTMVNGIGFSLTIISILVLDQLSHWLDPRWLMATLGLGPLFGVYHMRRLLRIE